MTKTFKSINPFDQSIIAEHALMSEQQLQQALQLAAHAFESWKKTSFETRNQLVRNIAERLRLNKENYARSISLEMGKILSESRIEIEKCAVTCEYYAQHGKEFLKDEIIATDAKKTLIAFQPIGAIFGIMPWNFPFWQVIRAAVPTILAGNVFLLKHAPNVSMCSKEIETLFLEAGFPEGVFQSLIVDIEVTEKIISHDIVQGVTLTGSEFAGSSVAALAGKHIKKSVLELGGSD
ncbi:MAG: aldehyde dehydrogenase family protein, partial [Chitinophagales bacterium]